MVLVGGLGKGVPIRATCPVRSRAQVTTDMSVARESCYLQQPALLIEITVRRRHRDETFFPQLGLRLPAQRKLKPVWIFLGCSRYLR